MLRKIGVRVEQVVDPAVEPETGSQAFGEVEFADRIALGFFIQRQVLLAGGDNPEIGSQPKFFVDIGQFDRVDEIRAVEQLQAGVAVLGIENHRFLGDTESTGEFQGQAKFNTLHKSIVNILVPENRPGIG